VRSGSVFRKWWPVPAAAIAAGALVTGLGGHGGYGLFSSAQTATGTLNAGSVTLGLTGSSSASTSWTISDVAPGDYYEAPLTLSDTGSIGISTVSLSATPGTSASLYSASTSPSGEDPVYVYALDCQGGSWTHAASGDPYSCTPPSGSSTTPTVTTVLGGVPDCASASNPADLSTCETSSYWMDPYGAVDAVPSGAVGVTSSGLTWMSTTTQEVGEPAPITPPPPTPPPGTTQEVGEPAPITPPPPTPPPGTTQEVGEPAPITPPPPTPPPGSMSANWMPPTQEFGAKPLSLPTATGASGESDVLTASGGSQSSANVLLVEYVNPNVTSSAEGDTGSLTLTFTGTQRAGTLKS